MSVLCGPPPSDQLVDTTVTDTLGTMRETLSSPTLKRGGRPEEPEPEQERSRKRQRISDGTSRFEYGQSAFTSDSEQSDSTIVDVRALQESHRDTIKFLHEALAQLRRSASNQAFFQSFGWYMKVIKRLASHSHVRRSALGIAMSFGEEYYLRLAQPLEFRRQRPEQIQTLHAIDEMALAIALSLWRDNLNLGFRSFVNQVDHLTSVKRLVGRPQLDVHYFPRTIQFLVEAYRRAQNKALVTKVIGSRLPQELTDEVAAQMLLLKGLPQSKSVPTIWAPSTELSQASQKRKLDP